LKFKRVKVLFLAVALLLSLNTYQNVTTAATSDDFLGKWESRCASYCGRHEDGEIVFVFSEQNRVVLHTKIGELISNTYSIEDGNILRVRIDNTYSFAYPFHFSGDSFTLSHRRQNLMEYDFFADSGLCMSGGFVRVSDVDTPSPDIASVVVEPNIILVGDWITITASGIVNCERIEFYAVYVDGTEELLAPETNPGTTESYRCTLNWTEINRIRVRGIGANEYVDADLEVFVSSSDGEIRPQTMQNTGRLQTDPVLLIGSNPSISRAALPTPSPSRGELPPSPHTPTKVPVPTITGVSAGVTVPRVGLTISGTWQYPTDRVLLYLRETHDSEGRVIPGEEDTPPLVRVDSPNNTWSYTFPADLDLLKAGSTYNVAVEAAGRDGSFESGWAEVRGFKVSTESFVWPVPSMHRSNSPWGYRVHDDGQGWHTGFDIDHTCGNGNNCGKYCKVHIVASMDGLVETAIKSSGGYGNQIIIKHDNGMRTLYGHNYVNLVSKGKRVKQGELIAYIGSTGHSFGPHLHFELRTSGDTIVNPLQGYHWTDHRSGNVNPNPLFKCTQCGNAACRGRDSENGGRHTFEYNQDFNISFFNDSNNSKWWQRSRNSW
jgi:hypothetical protein